jgi:hypothetical protein
MVNGHRLLTESQNSLIVKYLEIDVIFFTQLCEFISYYFFKNIL